MGTYVYFHPGIGQGLGGCGSHKMASFIFFIRHHRAVPGSCIHNRTRGVLQQFFIFPYIGLLIPVILRIRSTVVYDQGWCITYLAGTPQFDDVLVKRSNRNVVFDPGMAVHDHAHIMKKGRAAFWYDIDALLTSCLDDLLALISSGLVVTFHR